MIDFLQCFNYNSFKNLNFLLIFFIEFFKSVRKHNLFRLKRFLIKKIVC